jgi:uncharacterized RDD family membrane protein YckC
MPTSNESLTATTPSQNHPWRRFWARQIDYVLFQLTVAILLLLAAPSLFDLLPEPESTIPFVIAQAIFCALWVVPEAFFLSSFRTTPGKWMLGITVHRANGDILGFADALKRSAKVWAFGSAFGVYPISLLAFRKAYRDLDSIGKTSWDSQVGVQHVRPQKLALLCTMTLIASLNVIAVLPSTDEDYTSVVQEEVRAVAKNVENFYRDHGLEIASAAPIEMIRLGDGEVRETTQHLDRGGSVVIIGACDQDCSDLDLIVFGPEGDEIARDREADDRPLISFDPQLTGDYRIVATMHSCATEWCMGGYTVLRSASPTPAGSEGTGFVVDANGGILTAHHVIEDAASITVVFSDGRRSEAAVERRSPANDVALLRINAATPTYLPLARPRSTKVGDQVFVIGFPLIDELGDEAKFTEGSVTALSGSSGEGAQFQMSVPIQPGSSGSPVIDQNGHVVGIATSSASDEALLEETGAVPQLVNWATKAEIALALVGRQHAATGDRVWTASTRAEALAHAREATVRVLVEGD